MIERLNKTAPIIFAEGGLPEVARYLSETPRRWKGDCSQSNEPTRQWDGRAGWEGALAMAATGWSEGACKLSNNLHGLAIPSGEARNPWRYGVAGSRVNVARMTAGNPLHMKRRGNDMGRAPTVSIAVNVVASAGVSAEQFENFGLAMAGVIQWLEQSGTRVHLDALCAIDLSGSKSCARAVVGWNVKRAEDALDESAIAYSLAHPASFRRLAFALIERLPAATESYSYGRPGSLRPADADAVNLPTGALLIDGFGAEFERVKTPADCLILAAKRLNAARPDNPLIDVDALRQGLGK